ncbi:DUF2141 domain-containing protein [Undibacterium sp.]|uniref:DUF2141 domain-containing protein n=1 Tax=Undibacterium sp. TaxID=1914977 RepID=UPI00374DBDFF
MNKAFHKLRQFSGLGLNSVALIALLATATSATQAATLEITLEGVQAGKGEVIVTIYDSAEKFLHKSLRKLVVPASASPLRVQMEDLPPGDYAVALFQDINSNKKMDSNFMGMPSEPYGASNNAEGNFGPPSFESARFTIPAEGKKIAIKLHS